MATPLAALRVVSRDLLRAMIDIVLPRGCAGCGRLDTVLCVDCSALFHQHVRIPIGGMLSDYGYACGIYSARVRRAILAWKDHGDEECDRPLSYAMQQLAQSLDPTTIHRCQQYDRIILTAAPSSSTSMRRRGRRHVEPLLHAIGKALAARGIHAEYCPILASRGIRSRSVQTTSAHDRSLRVRNSISVRPHRKMDVWAAQSCAVILVDDIITSGATVRACIRALDNVNMPVITVLALAYTPPRGANGPRSIQLRPSLS